MKKFTTEALFDILQYLKKEVKLLKKNETLEFEVLNPDLCNDLYSGEVYEVNKTKYLYRSYKAWLDLAELLYCKVLTPKILSLNTVCISYKKLDLDASFHKSDTKKEEKYGTESLFFKINKNEEPTFLNAYLKALKFTKIQDSKIVLNLGINKADEFEAIEKLLNKEEFAKKQYYGIDFSESLIDFCKNRFSSSNFNFLCEDMNKIDSLNLPKADFLISIGTLQSSSLNFKPYFTSLVQNHLQKGASIVLGFPNTRWINGEMIYGAKVKNYSDSELSLLFKDVYFCKKYLQQKKYKVKVTGKNYIFLSAVFINT